MGPILRVVLTAVLLIGPPIYLAWFPSHFTPLVDVLFSLMLTFLAYSIGRNSHISTPQSSCIAVFAQFVCGGR